MRDNPRPPYLYRMKSMRQNAEKARRSMSRAHNRTFIRQKREKNYFNKLPEKIQKYFLFIGLNTAESTGLRVWECLQLSWTGDKGVKYKFFLPRSHLHSSEKVRVNAQATIFLPVSCARWIWKTERCRGCGFSGQNVRCRVYGVWRPESSLSEDCTFYTAAQTSSIDLPVPTNQNEVIFSVT